MSIVCQTLLAGVQFSNSYFMAIYIKQCKVGILGTTYCLQYINTAAVHSSITFSSTVRQPPDSESPQLLRLKLGYLHYRLLLEVIINY